MNNSLNNFFDERTQTFINLDEFRVSSFLGEELENPAVTFNRVENDFKARIDMLSFKLYQNAKELEKERQSNNDMRILINKDCKYLGESYYYAIKQHLNILYQQIESEKNLSSSLQRELNNLKAFNENLVNMIQIMNKRLDQLEYTMGIQMKSKRFRLSKNF